MEPFDDDITQEMDEPEIPEPVPGAVVVFENGRPACRTGRFDNYTLSIGSSSTSQLVVHDPRVAERHCWVLLRDDELVVSQPDDSSGTWVDGQLIEGRTRIGRLTTIRLGHSLVLLTADVTRFERWPVGLHGDFVGDLCQFTEIDCRLHWQHPVTICGESGTGKHRVARTMHDRGPGRDNPFIVVPCESVRPSRAVEYFFGPWPRSAPGPKGVLDQALTGTLLLENVDRLSRRAQPCLDRVLEKHTANADDSSDSVDYRDILFVTTTRRDLSGRVPDELFCVPFWGRIKNRITLPPLRDRREQIPWLIALEFQRLAPALDFDVTLAEACCFRRWRRDNIRELQSAIRAAIAMASARGDRCVTAEHLPPDSEPDDR